MTVSMHILEIPQHAQKKVQRLLFGRCVLAWARSVVDKHLKRLRGLRTFWTWVIESRELWARGIRSTMMLLPAAEWSQQSSIRRYPHKKARQCTDTGRERKKTTTA
jgi:hypothetical protein